PHAVDRAGCHGCHPYAHRPELAAERTPLWRVAGAEQGRDRGPLRRSPGAAMAPCLCDRPGPPGRGRSAPSALRRPLPPGAGRRAAGHGMPARHGGARRAFLERIHRARHPLRPAGAGLGPRQQPARPDQAPGRHFGRGHRRPEHPDRSTPGLRTGRRSASPAPLLPGRRGADPRRHAGGRQPGQGKGGLASTGPDPIMSLILRAPGRPRSLRRIRAPRWPVHALCLAAALVCQAAWADSALEARQARAREDRAALRTQIEALQKRIESSESSREDASRALQASEQAISDISRELAELDRRETVLQDTLRRLDAASSEQSGELERQQQALAAQLRAQYASGLSPWTALLSGRDPQEIGRELAWLAYVTRSRTQALDALRAKLDRLAGLRQQTDDSRRELDAVRADVRKRREDLQDQQAQRRE